MTPAVPTPHNIILIGFMGSGKTTVGRELQGLLGCPLVDTDAEIETRAGMTVSAIFTAEGEAGFRDRETALLREIAADAATTRIISTGGGIVTRPDNRALLPQLGYVVWLRVSVGTILARTRRSNTRPLLETEDPETRVRTLLAQREPWYEECAHLVLDTAGLDSGEVAVGILESARYHFSSLAAATPCPPP